jgi:hypothetical protein
MESNEAVALLARAKVWIPGSYRFKGLYSLGITSSGYTALTWRFCSG